jgi:hypothetical protein
MIASPHQRFRAGTGRSRALLSAFVATLALALVAAAQAKAATAPAPHWVAIVQAAPTDFHPGDGNDFYEVIAVNDGGTPTTEPITVTATLPAGVRGVEVNEKEIHAFAEITGVQNTLTQEFTSPCTEATEEGVLTVTCTTLSAVPVGRSIVVNINVRVSESASGTLLGSATVAGGGAAESATATIRTPIIPASQVIPFGESLASEATNAFGVDTQAGSHPFAFTALLDFNVGSVDATEKCNENITPSCAGVNAQAKDVEVNLPPGLVGNPTAVPYCTQAQFETRGFDGCPADSQVGSMYLYFYGAGTAVQYAPVYNIEPPAGQPAELGFSVSTLAHISMYFHVRSDKDYGLTAYIPDINQFDPVRIAALSIWGVPSDKAHDTLRLSEIEKCDKVPVGCPSKVLSPKPFLTMPTACTGPLSLVAAGDSWQEEPKAAPYPQLGEASISGMTGCEALQFHPSIDAGVDTHQAGAPAGYRIGVKVPQNEGVEGLATPDVRNVEVTLPEGVAVSPSAANGLSACSEALFGLKARSKGHCPNASKVGSVKIVTPLLSTPVSGALYIGEPECSPCSPAQAEAGQMVHLLLEAEGSGVVIKLSGHTKINQNTGRLTAVFTENPQLPFSELTVSLTQGPGAPVVNPAACAPAVATASIKPWSSTTASNVAAPPIPIEGCTAPGFAPGFRAGDTTTSSADAFTGFAVSLSRQDGEQALGRVSVSTPPGLLGVLKSVEQCAETQADAGTCSPASQIGTGSITLGAGSLPLTIGGSRVYLTGPYAGKPFGLSIVTPAQAGPFVLGGNTGQGTEVVRASIAVDPHTAALTVTSDPLPQALDGIPLNIRTININIDRERFMFNPTNCKAMSVAGTVASTTQTTAKIAFPFQSTNCRALAFKPKFTVITQGKTSKRNGASLHVKVVSGAGQANIAQVKVKLPIALPSRISTLQKACLDSVFEANPASCSAESVVGKATAVTPLLKNPLTGPAYIVSHAGRSFPDLEIVLQGEGITLVLTGNTDIKKGITSSSFKAVPDAPISTFDLVLPEGPHSVLTAFGNLCAKTLNMPTQITAQNGAVIKQTTKIGIYGCPKHKAAKR